MAQRLRLQVADAIFDGHRLAREIDEDNPETALPYIREFRMLGATDADYDSIISRLDSRAARPARIADGAVMNDTETE